MATSQQMFNSVGASAGVLKWAKACSVPDTCAARQMKNRYGIITAVSPRSSVMPGTSPYKHHMAAQTPSANNTNAARMVGQPDQGALVSCQAAVRLVLELGGKHRQVAGRQGAFAEQPAEQVGDAKGDHEGVHHAVARKAQKGGRGHVADHAQNRLASVPKLVTRNPANNWLRSAVAIVAHLKGGEALERGGFRAERK